MQFNLSWVYSIFQNKTKTILTQNFGGVQGWGGGVQGRGGGVKRGLSFYHKKWESGEKILLKVNQMYILIWHIYCVCTEEAFVSFSIRVCREETLC